VLLGQPDVLPDVLLSREVFPGQDIDEAAEAIGPGKSARSPGPAPR
jgi:hypothetical protein